MSSSPHFKFINLLYSLCYIRNFCTFAPTKSLPMNRCRPCRFVHPLRGCGDTQGNALGYRYASPDGDGFPVTYSVTHSHTVHSSLITAHSSHTFSAKERDSETGLSYFGARYYSSDLSIWLSVDPMSDKYPHQSGYVYCGNNPIMVVDPNGEDEYFNEYGFYLGSDNSESNNVRMITQNDWDFFKNVNEDDMMESISADFGTAVGSLISESDPSVFSDDAILGVYQHYGLESGNFEICEIKNSIESNINEFESGKYGMGYQSSTGNLYVPVSRNRKMALYDNLYNIINTFDHEYKHKIDKALDKNVREINADNYQMTTSSWKNTTTQFKDMRLRDLNLNINEFHRKNTK